VIRERLVSKFKKPLTFDREKRHWFSGAVCHQQASCITTPNTHTITGSRMNHLTTTDFQKFERCLVPTRGCHTSSFRYFSVESFRGFFSSQIEHAASASQRSEKNGKKNDEKKNDFFLFVCVSFT
jgi:hypothetical protein